MTLYRKYRPQSFAEVTGQHHVTVTLKHEVEEKGTTHAYLFCGPRGIGKTSTARILAKAVNCLKAQKGEPCTTCENCRAIQDQTALDLVEIDAASNRRIDEIRQLRENVKFLPAKFAYKVYIIDEVHMLTAEAFNALLKTLEEPPKHVIFILATTEVNKLPKTIISRCQRFDFSRASIEDIVERLSIVTQKEKKKISIEALKRVAKAAGGSLRDAEGILGKLFAMGDDTISDDIVEIVLPANLSGRSIKLLTHLLSGNSRESILLLEGAIDEGIDTGDFLNDLIETTRKVLLVKTSGTKGMAELFDVEVASEKEFLEAAEHAQAPQLTNILDRLLTAQQRMKLVDIPQLPLEMAIVELTSK